MPDEAPGTLGTPLTIETLSKHYKAALDSFQDCARAELAMIDVDAKRKADRENLSEEEQLKFADDEKRELLKSLRSYLIEGIPVIGDTARWDRVRYRPN